MRAVCTAWVLCAPYWRQMVPGGYHVHCMCTMREPCAPCGSHVCHMVAMWEPDGRKMAPYGSCIGSHMVAIWEHMGAMCAIWELVGLIQEVYAAI
jgi:hypothetical protein